MCRLLESIKYEKGTLHNLQLHEERMYRSTQELLGEGSYFDLKKEIDIPGNLKNGTYKCRIVYERKIISITFSAYIRKKINKIKLVNDEQIQYQHKFEDRTCILKHSQQLAAQEELIIVKKGLLSDASYSNIALYNGHEWHTPAHPLLKGTKREELLRNRSIVSKLIRPADLKDYERISFINALNVSLRRISVK